MSGRMERGDDITALPVQFFYIVKKSYRTGTLHDEAGRFSRYAPDSKVTVLPDQGVDSLTADSFFCGHFFFNILFTTRTDDTSLSVDVNTSTFQTCEERPL